MRCCTHVKIAAEGSSFLDVTYGPPPCCVDLSSNFGQTQPDTFVVLNSFVLHESIPALISTKSGHFRFVCYQNKHDHSTKIRARSKNQSAPVSRKLALIFRRHRKRLTAAKRSEVSTKLKPLKKNCRKSCGRDIPTVLKEFSEVVDI